MIVPDVNLLLYATFTGFPEHAPARTWLEGVMNGDQDVGLASPVLFGFLRIATHPRILDRPLSVESALAIASKWLDRPHVHLLTPGPRHLELSFQLLRSLGSAGNLTTDVQLAALAIEHQAELHSNDTDFGRFPQLRWINPLAKSVKR